MSDAFNFYKVNNSGSLFSTWIAANASPGNYQQLQGLLFN
jgi:hypothetical protein